MEYSKVQTKCNVILDEIGDNFHKHKWKLSVKFDRAEGYMSVYLQRTPIDEYINVKYMIVLVSPITSLTTNLESEPVTTVFKKNVYSYGGWPNFLNLTEVDKFVNQIDQTLKFLVYLKYV
jgi:hypothetical protein